MLYRILYVETKVVVEGLLYVLVNSIHVIVTFETIRARCFVVVFINAEMKL